MTATLTDQDFVEHLRRGPLGRDLAHEREAQRANDKQRIIRERAELEKKFELEFTSLQLAEDKALSEFRAASARLEAAQAKADAAYWNRTTAQAVYDKEFAKLNGQLIALQNPLVRELIAKLNKISEDAAKIVVVVETRAPAPNPRIIRLKPDGENFSNLAARMARQRLPMTIMNALHECVHEGHDGDNELNKIFQAGVSALPSAEEMRAHDRNASRMSPLCAAAFEEFTARVATAINQALSD